MNLNETKPPLTYYGGKQQLSKKILELIPEHKLYSEVFFGGGAIFFVKPLCQSVINDNNNNLINFYRQLKTNNKKLLNEIEATLYAQEEHRIANKLHFDKITVEDLHFAPEEQVKLKKAWSVFVLSHMSYLSIFGNTFNVSFNCRSGGRTSINNNPRKFNQKKINMVVNQYAERLQETTIFNDDAVKVLKKCDTDHTFHYIDPPYFNSNCGHYKGYSIEDFENLLKACTELKGKFILSSYPSDILTQYKDKYGWRQIEIDMHRSAGSQMGESKRKVEVITLNY
jgi:DNA adenine methylase